MDTYYDETAKGYDELHGGEQEHKLAIIKKKLKITKKTKLLDVGCGTGISSQFNCDVTGIDPSKALIEIAKKKFSDKKFIVASSENIPFEDNSFDVVVSLTAIQNFGDIGKGLEEIKRVGRKFALSFLKKSSKANDIDEKIRRIFRDYSIRSIGEDKDIIYIITDASES